ncbi:MAG: response regulator [Candidatus Eremiobacteraeota bacterium]|nr:response regulator [Candidatus Eremiobacteraeota bacterium]
MKVLIVDDSAAIRRQIRLELEEDGYEIHEAQDGVEAFKTLISMQPDLITLDVEMPNMDGYKTCEKLRSSRYSRMFKTSNNTKIPIIFVTGTDTLEGRARGFEVGATDFITKPFKKGEVLRAVNSILRPENIIKGLNAVVAEDNETTRSIIADYLRNYGVNVIEADNGREAFELISSRVQLVDMVITDLVMPEMGGEVLCRKIRNELNAKDIPVIILTGMSEFSSLLELFEAGATDYLVKPFVKEELLARLNVHLKVRLLNKELAAKIVQLEKLDQVKNRFLATCSHDLRSPLSGIINIVDYLDTEEPVDETTKQFLDLIKESAEYLYNLVSNILDLHLITSQQEEMVMKPFSLNETALSSIKTLTYMARPKDIELIFQNRLEGPVVIPGNELEIKRVINNLLSNSIKFTSKGGTVNVIIDSTEKDRLSLSVTDTGVGMAGNTISKILDLTKMTPAVGTSGERGSGLGLSIVKEIVQKHNGTFSITSKVGEGSTFTIALPMK